MNCKDKIFVFESKKNPKKPQKIIANIAKIRDDSSISLIIFFVYHKLHIGFVTVHHIVANVEKNVNQSKSIFDFFLFLTNF